MKSLCVPILATKSVWKKWNECNICVEDPNKAPFPKRIEDTSYGYQQNRDLDHTGKCLTQKYIQFSHVLKIFFLSLLINVVGREGFEPKISCTFALLELFLYIFSSFPIWNSWLEIKSKEYQETESGLHRRITKLLRLRSKLPIDEVAEWLRRWTANPMCSACVGSNPIFVDPFLVCCLSTLVRSLVFWCLIFLLLPSGECSINNPVNKWVLSAWR